MDVGFLFGADRPRPYCVPCHEQTDVKHRMEPTEVYSPAIGAYVDAWECPECDRQVMREGADGEVGLTAADGERL